MDSKHIMNPFHMEISQERQPVTKYENVRPSVVAKSRKGIFDSRPTDGQMSVRSVRRSLIKPENHHCFYYNGNDPYLQYGPIKAEILSDEPRIVQFYDIISDTEIEKIKSLSRKILQPSQLRDDLDDAHQIRQVYNSICDWLPRPVDQSDWLRASSSNNHFENL